tara:strand:+ start:458 stop:997 length:540 start_codon:yes stop_codon:yes gene_type:complete
MFMYEYKMSSDEEGETTALQIEQDEEKIEKIHERRSLLTESRKKVKSPSCRMMCGKVLCISIAGILFILMMVELWDDYGNVVATRTLFPPKIYSITETCPEGMNSTLTKDYNPLSCEWNVINKTSNEHLVCSGNMPSYPMALPYARVIPDVIQVDGNEVHMEWDGIYVRECVRLIVWSI